MGEHSTLGQFDLPRALDGGLTAQLTATLFDTDWPGTPVHQTLQTIDAYYEELEAYADLAIPAVCADDVLRAKELGKVALILSAEATITRLVRPEAGDPLLIITDTSNDMNLAEAYLAAGLRAGADTQLLIQQRPAGGMVTDPGPIVSEAILASRLILDYGDAINRAPATLEARRKGTRVLVYHGEWRYHCR